MTTKSADLVTASDIPSDGGQGRVVSMSADDNATNHRLAQLPIAERLDRIWIQRETELGHSLSYRKVLERLQEDNDDVKLLSTTYLNNLRKGKSDNPTVKVLQGLANYFRVSINYFLTDDDSEANFLLMQHNIERSDSFADLVNLLATLSEPGQDLVRSFVRYIKKHQPMMAETPDADDA